MKLFFRILFLAVAGLFLGYSIYLINARVIVGNPLPMPWGYGQAVVTSGSMSPAFEVDALLIYHAQKEYDIGDMVAFLDHDGSLVTHRIINIEGKMVTTKGDANSAADCPIEENRIYGKVICSIPHVGKAVRVLRKPELLLLLVLLLLGGLEWNCRQKKKAADERVEEQRRELMELRKELDAYRENEEKL